MTKDVVYRLKHKETGKYFVSIQTDGNPHLGLASNNYQLFKTIHEVARLYARVDAARAFIKNRQELWQIANMTDKQPSKSKVEEIIEIFDMLEIEYLQLTPLSKELLVDVTCQLNTAIRDARITQQIASNIDSITEFEKRSDIIYEGFLSWQRLKPNIDFIVQLRRKGEARSVVNALGIKSIDLDSDKPNVIKGYTIGISALDLQLIMVTNCEIIENYVDLKKILNLKSNIEKTINNIM